MCTYLFPGHATHWEAVTGLRGKLLTAKGELIVTKRKVILESPFGSADPAMIAENVTYARAALRDCLKRGDAPIASHLLYTQPGVLDDSVPEERALGIEAGLLWGKEAEASVVYIDRGITAGMVTGVVRAIIENRAIEFHTIADEAAMTAKAAALNHAVVEFASALRG